MLHTEKIPAPAIELLRRLMSYDLLQQFALVGGTSLTLRFNHRLSVDIDLFTDKTFSPIDVINALRTHENLTLLRTSETMGFFTIDDVKVDLVYEPYPSIQAIETIDAIRLYSIHDVAAMKLNAISRRGSKKDFYDLAELLLHYKLSELVEWYQFKYSDPEPTHLLRSITYFEDAEDGEQHDGIRFTFPNTPSWEEVKTRIRKAMAMLRK